MADVKFDCKTATVTMQGAATLAGAAAEKALKDAGFGMKSIAGGPPPTNEVLRAVVTTAKGEAPAQEVLAALVDAAAAKAAGTEILKIAGAKELFIEPDGRLTVCGAVDMKLDEKTLGEALAARGLALRAGEKRAWPRSAAGYVVSVKELPDAAARAKARDAIEKIENVLSALARNDGRFLVFTREPCSNLEERLKGALEPAGLALAKLEER